MSKHSQNGAPTDVLAADAFPLGVATASRADAEKAHDVLAADEFAVPAGDPALHEAHAHHHEPGAAHGGGPLRPAMVSGKAVGIAAGVVAVLMAAVGVRRRRARRRAAN